MHTPRVPWLLALLLAAACRDPAAPAPKPREAAPPRRVIDPPGTVRPLPPYAISNSGVGPYQLGASLSAVLYELPSGPRMVLLDVPELVKQNVIRAEDDAILVSGAVMGEVKVVAVVREAVARTESGIAVGTTRAELAAELVTDGADSTVARDPRLAVTRRLPAARMVLRGDKVQAVVLASGGPPQAPVPQVAAPPEKPAPPVKVDKEGAGKEPRAVVAPRCAAPRPAEMETGPWMAACLSASGEVVRVRDEEVSVRSGGDGKERPLAVLRVRGLLFAAPLRASERAEERDDLVVVSKVARAEDVTWTVAIYHLEAGRLVRVAEQIVYRLSAEGARWIGVSLEEAEIYLELAAREDGVVVGGFLVISAGDRIRDVVALREVSISRRRGIPEASALPMSPKDGGAVDSASPVDAGP
ncbi:MAG: hypothetical protein IPI49_07075 [Myxococcales bacterium]|nr:hypothetical protein [Myxococcales bacterium]